MREADISATIVLLNIIGGVCILLWGLRMVRKGMTRVMGVQFRSVISNATNNRLKAFMAGIGVTALLQSSTATTMIISSFAGKKLIGLSAALAVVLGADVGTTIIAQILSFDFSWLAPLFLVIGYFIFVIYENEGKVKYIGRVIIGLGFMLFALGWISLSSEPLKNSEGLIIILKLLSNDAILAIIFGAIITWLCHSSLAVILLIVSLSSGNVIPVELGLLLVLGANLGGVIAPLLTSFKDGEKAARIPVGNLIMRISGVALAIPFIPLIHEYISLISEAPERVVVNFHMFFNIALAIIFLPLTSFVAAIAEKIIPERYDEQDQSKTVYLDEKDLDNPAIALASASRETLRIADMVEKLMRDWMKAFTTNNEVYLNRTRDQDDVIDAIYSKIKHYMARLTQEAMEESEANKHIMILTYATNLEHIGDIVDNSLIQIARKKIRSQKRFSEEGYKEIVEIYEYVMESTKLAQNLFISGDLSMAEKLIASKNIVKKAEAQASLKHMERLRKGIPETLATSSMHMDIIRDFKRINDYLINIAYQIIEENEKIPDLKPEPADEDA